MIDDLELTLEPGTLTWIGGSNGVGKTTMLRVLAGLIGPTKGHVRVFGLHPERDRRAYQQHLSFLPPPALVSMRASPCEAARLHGANQLRTPRAAARGGR